jgi:hypothetical protein
MEFLGECIGSVHGEVKLWFHYTKSVCTCEMEVVR